MRKRGEAQGAAEEIGGKCSEKFRKAKPEERNRESEPGGIQVVQKIQELKSTEPEENQTVKEVEEFKEPETERRIQVEKKPMKLGSVYETEIYMVEDVTIPARSEANLEVKLKEPVLGHELLVEGIGSGILEPGVMLARTIIENPGKKSGIVRAINTNSYAVSIGKRSNIGTAGSKVEILRTESSEVNMIESNGKNVEDLMSEFALSHLDDNPHALRLLENLLLEHRDLFCSEGKDITTVANNVEHSIFVTPGTVPIAKRPYRVPYSQREILNQEIDKLLRAGIIKPSTSPWSAPVVLVAKKSETRERKIRMCIDYRGLNAVTKRDFYPLPIISETLEQFGSSTLFSVIDVTWAYHQIAVREQDQELTAFSTPEGHYHYSKMPFGLVNAPATFQRFVNITLAGLVGETCLAYLDDIIVYNSRGVEEHLAKLAAVFARLKEANFKLQPSKCRFLVSQVKYLGHIITKDGVQPDPEKLEKVREYPIPTSVKDVRACLGLTDWYRRFIREYSEKALPLTKLTKKDTKFERSLRKW